MGTIEARLIICFCENTAVGVIKLKYDYDYNYKTEFQIWKENKEF